MALVRSGSLVERGNRENGVYDDDDREETVDGDGDAKTGDGRGFLHKESNCWGDVSGMNTTCRDARCQI